MTSPITAATQEPGSVDPPSGRGFARVDRGGSAPAHAGVIRADDPVVTAFARIGWEWGGYWVSSKDYQHFAARGAR